MKRRTILLILVPVLVLVLVLVAYSGLAFRSAREQAVFSEINAGLDGELSVPMTPAAPAGDYAGEAEMALERQGATYATAASLANEPQAGQLGLDRLVIKNADLALEVENVRDAENAVRTRVNQLGGYVVGVETSGTDESMTSRVTFRVPAERFEEALAGVQGLAHKVLSRSVSGDDVTEEFVDLESRLTNLEATRDRLLTFLDKATKVEDALQVNQALSDVQGQIEQIRGRMQYLKQSAALSTVSVYLVPVPVTPIVQEGAWQPIAVARAALRDLIELGQGLVNVAIVLLVWTPVWLPLLLLGLWGWRKVRDQLGRPTGGATGGTAGGPAAPETV